MALLEAEIIMSLNVKCSEAFEIGCGTEGLSRVIPIIGGRFAGKLSGDIISGGADWNTENSEHATHVFAKYLLHTVDGEYIGIQNEGMIDFQDNQLIRTFVRFNASKDGNYAWMNTGVYVGNLSGGEQLHEVSINIYKMY